MDGIAGGDPPRFCHKTQVEKISGLETLSLYHQVRAVKLKGAQPPLSCRGGAVTHRVHRGVRQGGPDTKTSPVVFLAPVGSQ